jgi:multiple sugar transport system substrate-binding protein
MSGQTLRGITWNHSPALPPLVATAQRYEELHSSVSIQWEKRMLHEFGHANLTALADTFDLLVIDHPMTGDAQSTRAIIDLFSYLGEDIFRDFAEDSLGLCFESYQYDGALYALPIDAAAPAASYRADLLNRLGLSPPKDGASLLELARHSVMAMPGFPADLFLNFMGMCVSRGSPVATDPEIMFDRRIALHCLEDLRELAEYLPKDIYTMNPIALYEGMSSSHEIAYCPFAYTYSNYSRNGFGDHPIEFCRAPALTKNIPMRTVLGGTGIAISARCSYPETALDYILFTAGKTSQSTIYGMCGGQPFRRSAWQDATLNAVCRDFFRKTQATIESAYVRPRYRGYAKLQETAGEPIRDYLRNGDLPPEHSIKSTNGTGTVWPPRKKKSRRH